MSDGRPIESLPHEEKQAGLAFYCWIVVAVAALILSYGFGRGGATGQPNRAQLMGALPRLPTPPPATGAGGVVGW